jgi:hypothetical protein
MKIDFCALCHRKKGAGLSTKSELTLRVCTHSAPAAFVATCWAK